MVWTPTGPQGNEAAKIKYLAVPYTRGRGLDIGCGAYKAFPHFIGVDSGKQWGQPITDVTSDGGDLSMFAAESMDFVFSSHFLEHVEDTAAALKEWWRVIRPGGHMVLYLPHKNLYPNIGEPGSNPDHKHDFLPGDILQHMIELVRDTGAGWDCLEFEDRAEGIEYSFYQVYRKREDELYNLTPWERPDKSVLLIRYGAFGDLVQTASVTRQLKQHGYHVTLNTTGQGFDIAHSDPNVDAFLIQDKNQVPQEDLPLHWAAWAERYDRIVNLSESVEGSLLAVPGRPNHRWDHDARHKLLNINYMEFMHDIAGVPHAFSPAFFATAREHKWAQKQRKRVGGGSVILWALSGSSVHKAYPFVQDVLGMLFTNTSARVVLCGGPECRILEEFVCESLLNAKGTTREELEAWQAEHGDGYLDVILKKVNQAYGGQTRLFTTSGKWSIRESLAFAQVSDVVVGPETGVLNAVANEQDVAKVVFLSHSSHENLTKHWVNTAAIEPQVPCYPCHRLHFNRQFCPQHEDTGAAVCAAAISPHDVFATIATALNRGE